MKIEVNFTPIYTGGRSFILSTPSLDEPYSSPYASFVGTGTILLHETGIFLEGDMPKLKLGWLPQLGFLRNSLYYFCKNAISSKAIITIPYAKILNYRRGLRNEFHIIVYESAYPCTRTGNQERITIRFKCLKSSKQYEEKFFNGLDEYVRTTKALLIRK